jgi:uracil phosphoribosyltransferase
MERLGMLLAQEATRDLPVVAQRIQTPVAAARVWRLKPPWPLLLPVLRAGLGLLGPFRQLLPDAPVGMVGVVRDHMAQPHPYLERIPPVAEEQPCFVLDPMLATGGTASWVLQRLGERGVRGSQVTLVVVIAAPPGLAAVSRALPGVRVLAAAVDPQLDRRGYIVPGLGDAGDRLWGTPDAHEEGEP